MENEVIKELNVNKAIMDNTIGFEKLILGKLPSNMSIKSNNYSDVDGWELNGDGTATIRSMAGAGYESRTTTQGTGTQDVNVGFKPSMIRITAFDPGEDRISISSFNGNTTETKSTLLWTGTVDFTASGQRVINLGLWATADLSTINNNGFTINWTAITKDIQFTWEAYK